MKKTLFKITASFILLVFAINIALPVQVYGQALNLPIPGMMIQTTEGFHPAIIRGLTIHPDNPLKFNFIIDTGDTGLDLEGPKFEEESTKLIKYFLASLTVPEKEMWVNLSPYEKDRIIPENFGITEMGRDMLAMDYMLKQLTASLMYPEDELGEKFWNRIFEKAYEKYGTTEIPINTFNKVWIVPDKGVVYEHENSVFVVDSHLKVMLETDYLALEKNSAELDPARSDNKYDFQTKIIREIIIPAIEKEINEGKTFANLRQIYNSMILAVWYKKNLKESLLGQVYMDQNKVQGIDVKDKKVKQKIYDQYLKAFEKGVYNYIKEDFDPVTQEIIPRKYFSGGVVALGDVEVDNSELARNKAGSPIGSKGDVLVSLVENVYKTAIAGALGLGISMTGMAEEHTSTLSTNRPSVEEFSPVTPQLEVSQSDIIRTIKHLYPSTVVTWKEGHISGISVLPKGQNIFTKDNNDYGQSKEFKKKQALRIKQKISKVRDFIQKGEYQNAIDFIKNNLKNTGSLDYFSFGLLLEKDRDLFIALLKKDFDQMAQRALTDLLHMEQGFHIVLKLSETNEGMPWAIKMVEYMKKKGFEQESGNLFGYVATNNEKYGGFSDELKNTFDSNWVNSLLNSNLFEKNISRLINFQLVHESSLSKNEISELIENFQRGKKIPDFIDSLSSNESNDSPEDQIDTLDSKIYRLSNLISYINAYNAVNQNILPIEDIKDLLKQYLDEIFQLRYSIDNVQTLFHIASLYIQNTDIDEGKRVADEFIDIAEKKSLYINDAEHNDMPLFIAKEYSDLWKRTKNKKAYNLIDYYAEMYLSKKRKPTDTASAQILLTHLNIRDIQKKFGVSFKDLEDSNEENFLENSNKTLSYPKRWQYFYPYSTYFASKVKVTSYTKESPPEIFERIEGALENYLSDKKSLTSSGSSPITIKNTLKSLVFLMSLGLASEAATTDLSFDQFDRAHMVDQISLGIISGANKQTGIAISHLSFPGFETTKFIYDAAIDPLVLKASGKQKRAEIAMDRYARALRFAKENNNRAGILGIVKTFEGRYGPNNVRGLINAINVKSTQPQGQGSKEYKVTPGPNAFMAMSFLGVNTKRYLDVALMLGELLLSMQKADGSVQAGYYDVDNIHIEPHMDAFAVFQQLYEVTNDQKWKKAADKAWKYFVTSGAYDPKNNAIWPGVHNGRVNKSFATDNHSWTMAGPGGDRMSLSELQGFTATMLTKSLTRITLELPDGKVKTVILVDFADPEDPEIIGARGGFYPMGSVEWTAGVILALQKNAVRFWKSNNLEYQKTGQLYKALAEYLTVQALDTFYELPGLDGVLSFYATGQNVPTGHGWSTPIFYFKRGDNIVRGGSFISSWIALPIKGLNPLILRDTYKKSYDQIPLDSSIKQKASRFITQAVTGRSFQEKFVTVGQKKKVKKILPRIKKVSSSDWEDLNITHWGYWPDRGNPSSTYHDFNPNKQFKDSQELRITYTLTGGNGMTVQLLPEWANYGNTVNYKRIRNAGGSKKIIIIKVPRTADYKQIAFHHGAKDAKGRIPGGSMNANLTIHSIEISPGSSPLDVGGINFDSELLDLQIKRDGKGVPLPVWDQPIEDMNINGFYPVILNITPINVPLLLGLVDESNRPISACPEEDIDCIDRLTIIRKPVKNVRLRESDIGLFLS